GDQKLTRAEAQAIQAEQQQIAQAYAALAAKRGYPPGAIGATSPQSFAVYGAGQAIAFEWLAGKDLRSGALGELTRALGAGSSAKDPAAADAVAQRIAFDLATSPDAKVAADKVHLLRAALASAVPDRALQKAALAKVGAALDAQVRAAGGASAMTRAQFDAAASFQSTAAAHATALPAEVRGTDKVFPNKPLPGYEASTRAATRASLDDLSAAGKLFLDKIPPGGPPKTVALKVDLNFGADGPPTVTDPTETGAMVAELLERAKAQGKSVKLTVGESAGGENIALGRTTLDIMRDTGSYHYALKSALAFAAKEGNPAAAASLAKVEAAEARGVFFGSKDDAVSTPADLQAAEDAAAKYMTVVDYDAAGFKSIDPKLGPLGLAAWGTREFRIAKPWADADYRVHVARPVSTHTLAGWTGATKGLIGLHEFGLRPTDQGMNARGQHPLDGFLGLTQAAGVASIFETRTGTTGTAEKIRASGDPALKALFEGAEAKWQGLQRTGAAWTRFASGAAALAAKLKADRAAGMSEPDVMNEMRRGTRALLDAADKAQPGFRRGFWDAAQAMTRTIMASGGTLRTFIPSGAKDDAQGARIGLLAKLPYPSDLVVLSQPKIG
ncbi:MAG TPA: hypothetical protein VHF22_09305, partial [Planctomycetota bacterium]|nr:hypothetical protein [Planctomycetota bacterium]